MRWFRANRRSCGWLALFALAVQIGLSFGHVHAEHAGPQTTDGAATLSAGTSPLPAPADREGHRPDDDCPICASIALAASVLLPDPPAFIVPAPPPAAPLADGVAALVPGDLLLQARARSPPRDQAAVFRRAGQSRRLPD